MEYIEELKKYRDESPFDTNKGTIKATSARGLISKRSPVPPPSMSKFEQRVQMHAEPDLLMQKQREVTLKNVIKKTKGDRRKSSNVKNIIDIEA